MKKIIVLLTLAVLLSGCATSTGVVSTGQNTKLITRTKWNPDGSSNDVKAAAIKEANRYCKSCGKVIKVISTSQKDMIPFKSRATAEVQFMCLDANDPRLSEDNKGVSIQSGDDLTTIEIRKNNGKVATDDKSNSITFAQVNKLKTLNKLLSDGLITQKDFEESKQKLLDDYTAKK